MTSKKLFVSFWDIYLDNLPVGTFTHRRITAEQAKRLIAKAREKNKLMCAGKDILAPYRKHDRERHEELSGVLKKHFGIALTLKDFTSEFEQDGERHYTVNPLIFARVQGRNQLLVITCSYTYTPGEKSKKRVPLRLNLVIEPTNVEFHLFESQESSK